MGMRSVDGGSSVGKYNKECSCSVIMGFVLSYGCNVECLGPVAVFWNARAALPT